MNATDRKKIEFPEIGTYEHVSQALILSRKTIYKMTSARQFRKGIYLGRGRFNMTRLRECIESGSYIRGRA